MSMLVAVHMTTEVILKSIYLFRRFVYCYYYMKILFPEEVKNISQTKVFALNEV